MASEAKQEKGGRNPRLNSKLDELCAQLRSVKLQDEKTEMMRQMVNVIFEDQKVRIRGKEVAFSAARISTMPAEDVSTEDVERFGDDLIEAAPWLTSEDSFSVDQVIQVVFPQVPQFFREIEGTLVCTPLYLCRWPTNYSLSSQIFCDRCGKYIECTGIHLIGTRTDMCVKHLPIHLSPETPEQRDENLLRLKLLEAHPFFQAPVLPGESMAVQEEQYRLRNIMTDVFRDDVLGERYAMRQDPAREGEDDSPRKR